MSQFFSSSTIDQAILSYLRGRLAGGGPAESHDYLTQHSLEMIEAITDAYRLMPAKEYAQEREELMMVIFEVLQNVPNTKDSADAAKEFFAWVIEADLDPLVPGDPRGGPQLVAFQQYLLYEYDNRERERLRDLILQRSSSPTVRAQVKKLLREEHPTKIWIDRDIRGQER